MKLETIFLPFCVASMVLVGVAPAPAAQEPDKLVYADFETSKDGRPVSNGGGLVQLTSYQESPTLKSRFKAMEGSNPPAPELVRISKDSPNKAIAFEYELQAPNQYAGVGVEINAQADKDGKPVSIDVSQYKYLSLQLYVTGVQSIRVEFSTRGQGVPKSNANPQMIFKIKPGLNTYQIPLKNLSQPSWADVKLSPKDVLKKLTSVSVVAFCDQCTPTKGTVVIDNLVFQN